MAILKHRPRVKLLVPREIRAGQEFEASIEVDAKRELDVEVVDVTLAGRQRVVVGAGSRTMVQTYPVTQLGAQLSGPTRLTVGKRLFPVRFPLPRDLPPTYAGGRVRIEYVATVHIGIPWWPDRRSRFELFVRAAPPDDVPDGSPVIYSTRPAGPHADEPYLEASLASDVAAPKGLLAGALALGNSRDAGFERIEVSLVSVESSRVGNSTDAWTVTRFEADLGLPPAEGVSLPFRVPLPADIGPTFTASHGAHEWQLELKAKRRWRSDLSMRIPIKVFPSGTTLTAKHQAPPAVGSDRLTELWSSVAAAVGLRHDEGVMHGTFGEVDVEIRRENRGNRGMFVLGELRYPSLGIDLAIEPAGTLRRIVRQGVPLGREWWDERHLVTGREKAQIDSFGKTLLPSIHAFHALQMDDSRAVVEWRDPGQTQRALTEFAHSIVAFASAVPDARRAIPPPAVMRDAVAAWRAVAETLDAKLDVASMSIRGTHGGAAAEIRTEWSRQGEPVRTVVAVSPAVELDERASGHVGPGSRGEPDVSAMTSWSGEARAQGSRLVTEARSLDVSPRSIELSLDAPVADPSTLVARLDALLRLAALLAPGGGPYR